MRRLNQKHTHGPFLEAWSFCFPPNGHYHYSPPPTNPSADFPGSFFLSADSQLKLRYFIHLHRSIAPSIPTLIIFIFFGLGEFVRCVLPACDPPWMCNRRKKSVAWPYITEPPPAASPSHLFTSQSSLLQFLPSFVCFLTKSIISLTLTVLSI